MLRICLLAALFSNAQDLPSTIESQVRRLSTEDPAEREAAVTELVKLGREALPLLERQATVAGSAEAKDGLARAVRGILLSDPLFLVRPPERRVTVRLEGVPASDALEAVFRPFPKSPQPDSKAPQAWQEKKSSVTLSLQDARFWEAVVRFAEASGTFVRFDGSDEIEYSVERGSGSHSKPAAAHVVSGAIRKTSDGLELDLRLHTEPGWNLESSGVGVAAIEIVGGKSPLGDFDPGPREEARAFKVSFKMKAGSLPSGTKLRVKGTAWVRAVTRVEGAVVRSQGFPGQRELTAGDYTLVLGELRSEGGSLSYKLKVTGGPKPGVDKSPQAALWHLIADDSGRVENPIRQVGASNSSCPLGLNGGRRGTPTRLGFLRPLEFERLELPFTIEGVVVP